MPFLNSEAPSYATRAHYLSGNVRAKYEEALEAAQEEPQRWESNVEALRSVDAFSSSPT